MSGKGYKRHKNVVWSKITVNLARVLCVENECSQGLNSGDFTIPHLTHTHWRLIVKHGPSWEAECQYSVLCQQNRRNSILPLSRPIIKNAYFEHGCIDLFHIWINFPWTEQWNIEFQLYLWLSANKLLKQNVTFSVKTFYVAVVER